MRLTISLPFGTEGIDRELERIKANLSDFTPVWSYIIGRFRTLVSQRFAAQGPGWAPLSPNYARWKAKRHPGRTILVRKGDLARSLFGTDAQMSVYMVSPRHMKIGSTVAYGEHHQTGTARMPARPPLPKWSEHEKRNWVKAAQRYCITGSIATLSSGEVASIVGV